MCCQNYHVCIYGYTTYVYIFNYEIKHKEITTDFHVVDRLSEILAFSKICRVKLILQMELFYI